ncbi:dynein associated protein-domain-containing protein [Chaetomidium leptoderma]|uniref:Dynein associated protein-domain-containing protein n=1 Tax=Chaetomidium leptoderma TaxID=669021 RepID=A0AAN6ZYM6_9PEZI|nr:dynein associated protein-domain-containing protein [Chaetomidium leptoderma]
MSLSELTAGRKVQLSDQRYGTIRYAGQTSFAPGLWVGIELEDASGKNDGTVQGERYFECPMGYGMFVRPTTMKLLAQPAAPYLPQPAKKTARPSSLFSSASSRGSTPADPGMTKRKSLNAPSPTPASRPSRTPSGIRSPTRSPTKQLGTAPSSGVPSRTNTPSNAKPAPGGRPRPSVTAGRPSMAPPPMPGTRPARQGSTATAPRTSNARTPSGRLSTVARVGAGRPATSRHTSSSSQSGVEKTRPIAKRSSASSTASAPKSSDDEILSPQPTSPVQLRTMALEKLTGPAHTSKSPSAPGAALATSRPAASTTAANKEVEDLKAKLRVLEKKRMEDREKLNLLEKVKSERDRFERIIQTLQIKYQPQQQEIADLKRQLKEAETRFYNVEEMQENHESAMELATLDREMAEEMAEVYKTELDALKQKSEELELEVEILREENGEFTKGMSSEDRASTGWLQMEKNNERLRQALIRLRDISREQEEELKDQIKGLQEDLVEFETFRDQFDTCKADLAQRDAAVEDLREQLDNALGAEDLIESLTEQTMNQSERIEELKASIALLEDLKEIGDELEINHTHNAKELQEEIDTKDAIIGEQIRQAAVQRTSMEDMEYTLSRFRELVTSLQSDLADMRASHAVTENESEQLNSRSRAMLDLNMKLHLSAAKAQVKTIDLELRRMEAQEAEQHLEIVTMFLPDSYQSDKDSVLALLRFKRLAFKANILNGFIKERINGQTHPGHEDDVFEGCGALDKLTWVTSMCDRFVNAISHCSLEEFAKYDGALYELEPVERALNGWIEALKRDELKEKQCSAELQRTIALMTHLGEVHISNDLESFADDIHMKALLMQSHLESAAVAFATTKAMVQSVVPQTDDEDELGQYFSKKAEGVITQTRSAKVLVGKTVRALEDLKSRSLSLLPETLEAFEQCEAATAELTDMARRIGLDLHEFVHEEGRTEPYTHAEIQTCTQKTAMAAFSSSEADLFSTYVTKLRIVTSQISDLAALSTDLSHTQEFERSTAPWILRSQELKVLKKVPVEVEAETRRLKDDLTSARRTLAIREEDFSTAQLKIETLESRMRDAKAKTARISELESQIEAAKEQAAALSDSITKQDRELKSLELERDKWKQVASSSRVVAGSGAEGGEAGTKANQERAVATARELDNLRVEIDGLQAAVRYLRDDNRRARMTEQPSYDWLAEPLTKNVPPAEQRKAMVTTESRAVLGELVNLASGATVFDMASLPADRVAWKPARSTPQYHAAKQMEDFGAWKGWQDAAVKKGRAVKAKVPASARAGGEGLGRKSMGAAGAKLQIRLPGIDGKVVRGRELEIVGSREWEALQGSRRFLFM